MAVVPLTSPHLITDTLHDWEALAQIQSGRSFFFTWMLGY